MTTQAVQIVGNPAPQELLAETTQRVEKLESVRGVAALAVVLDHCRASYDWQGTLAVLDQIVGASPLALLMDGSAAVIMFFVLSGYVLSLSYLRGRPLPYASFVVRRGCRLYIPFALTTLLAAAVLSQIPHVPPPGAAPHFMNMWGTVTWELVVKHLELLDPANKINPPTWSL
ncbi:MAG: acyltransferase, partial [Proteobacteria bacterium]|nr:acyltransferase [Pseudomonadota bacterium]